MRDWRGMVGLGVAPWLVTLWVVFLFQLACWIPMHSHYRSYPPILEREKERIWEEIPTMLGLIFPMMMGIYVVYHFMVRRRAAAIAHQRFWAFTILGGGSLCVALLVSNAVIRFCHGPFGWSPYGPHLSFGWALLLQVGLCFVAAVSMAWLALFFTPRDSSTGLSGSWFPSVAVMGCVLLLGWLPVVGAERRHACKEVCLLHIRNAQQAMRSFQGIHGANRVMKADIVGPGLFLEGEPVCPCGGSYTWHEGPVLDIGELFLRCSHESHVPADYSGW